jgi:hypothetical protein
MFWNILWTFIGDWVHKSPRAWFCFIPRTDKMSHFPWNSINLSSQTWSSIKDSIKSRVTSCVILPLQGEYLDRLFLEQAWLTKLILCTVFPPSDRNENVHVEIIYTCSHICYQPNNSLSMLVSCWSARLGENSSLRALLVLTSQNCITTDNHN